MLISKSDEYALRAIIYLASLEPEARMSAQELAAATGAFPAFLSKVVQKLVHAGILASKRGPGGGVALARPPEEIRLWDVIVALEGPDYLQGCVLGLETCDPERPCPLHHDWVKIREQIFDLLRAKTLADLATSLETEGARIKRRLLTAN